MSLSPNLRKLEPADAAWLEALHAECFDETRRWSAQLFLSFLQAPAARGYAYGDGGEPAAFILGQSAGDAAEIVTLATRPRFQRRGYGEILVKHYCQYLESTSKTGLFLEVAVNNLAAIGLYTKLGFTKSGLRPNYYRMPGGQDIDACIMQKAL